MRSAALNSVFLCFKDTGVKKHDGKQLYFQTDRESMQLIQFSKRG